MFLVLANALSDCCRTWTGTRRRTWCVCPSRSRWQSSSTTRERGTLNQNARLIAVREGRNQKKFPWDPLAQLDLEHRQRPTREWFLSCRVTTRGDDVLACLLYRCVKCASAERSVQKRCRCEMVRLLSYGRSAALSGMAHAAVVHRIICSALERTFPSRSAFSRRTALRRALFNVL